MSRVYNFFGLDRLSCLRKYSKKPQQKCWIIMEQECLLLEMSHRSKAFEEIITAAEQDLRDLMNIPDNYKVLFLQGGASQQFAMIPMKPDEEERS